MPTLLQVRPKQINRHLRRGLRIIRGTPINPSNQPIPQIKILCVTCCPKAQMHEQELRDLAELQTEHDLTLVHTYEDAKERILDAPKGSKPFTVVLSDCFVPLDNHGESSQIPFMLCLPSIDQGAVRGLGIFIPPGLKNEGVLPSLSPGNKLDLALVATRGHIQGGIRQWKQLLTHVYMNL